MLRSSCAALLLAMLLMLWCGTLEVHAAPTFGLLFGHHGNGTSLLESIVQAKINALNILADYIAIATAGSSG